MTAGPFTRPKLLDLFCGAGGAGRGYMDAGFEVTGIDIEDQPDYPGTFIRGDALEYLQAHGHEYDAVHASPPCQASSNLTKGTNKGRQYVNLIPGTRKLLSGLSVPTVMENVQGSDLRRDMVLCGEMFGLGVIRHRYFELENFEFAPPAHLPHRGRVRGWRHGQYFDGPYLAVHGEGGGKGSVAEWQVAMGISWTNNRKSIAEAIPPAYTAFIGGQVLDWVLAEDAEAA
jgi:DNA (cytosine-5)-methyltransferase 1